MRWLGQTTRKSLDKPPADPSRMDLRFAVDGDNALGLIDKIRK